MWDVIIAVSDGHGGQPSFRSDFGSHAAVSTAVKVVRAFAQQVSEPGSAEELRRSVLAAIPIRILQGWTDAVTQDLTSRPFMDRELEGVRQDGYGAHAAGQLEENPLIAYGATLVIAALVGRYLVCLQLGDGDIVTVGPGDPPVVTRPVPHDDRLIGNQTTSLCLPDAASDFRCGVIDTEVPGSPEIVIVTSDGYVNSFVDDDAFLQAGPDILGHATQHGLDWVAEQLPGWLEGASRLGSGDDITMGIACRVRAVDGKRTVDDAFAKTITQPGSAPRSADRLDRPLRIIAIIAIVAVLGVWLGAVAFSSSSPAPDGPQSPSPSSAPTGAETWIWIGRGTLIELSGKDPGRPLVVPELRDVRRSEGVAWGFGWIWVLTRGTLYRVDPSGSAPVEHVDLSSPPGGLAIGRSDVVVATADGQTLLYFDPVTLAQTQTDAFARDGSTVTPPRPPSATGTASTGPGKG
jgi:hypothetical protein